MPHKWSPSAVTTCRYESWTTETRTDTPGAAPCAYSVKTVSYTQRMVFIYSSKNSFAWSRPDVLECFGAHVDEWVRHDWLLWTWGRGLNTGNREGRTEKGRVLSLIVSERQGRSAFSLLSPSVLFHSHFPWLISFIPSVLCFGPAHVLWLRMLDRSISVHSWGTSGFSIMRCHSRCSSPYESIQSTSFP